MLQKQALLVKLNTNLYSVRWHGCFDAHNNINVGHKNNWALREKKHTLVQSFAMFISRSSGKWMGEGFWQAIDFLLSFPYKPVNTVISIEISASRMFWSI